MDGSHPKSMQPPVASRPPCPTASPCLGNFSLTKKKHILEDKTFVAVDKTPGHLGGLEYAEGWLGSLIDASGPPVNLGLLPDE